MHDGDGYLLKVLDELCRRPVEDDRADANYSADFHSSTLEELGRRIRLEMDLKSILAQLTKEASNKDVREQLEQLKSSAGITLGHYEDMAGVQKVLREELSKLKIERDAHLQEVQRLSKVLDDRSQKDAEYLKLIQDLRAARADLQARFIRLYEENTDLEKKLHDANETHGDLQKKIVSLEKDQNLRKADDSDCTKNEKSDEHRTQKAASDSNSLSSLVTNLEEHKKGENGVGGTQAQGNFGNQLPIGLPLLGPQPIPITRSIPSTSAPPNLSVLPDRETITLFNRHFLSEHLGGVLIALQVRIAPGKQKPLARKFGITSFMCPNLDHNPWAPLCPGQNGYMFVGLGNEMDAFSCPETHELFIQFAPKQMFYAGKYSFQKVEDLTVDEWQGLDTKVKNKYCETTISKTKKNVPCSSVLEAYNNGQLRVPCVLLRFLHFNRPLYEALSNAGIRAIPSTSTSAPMLYPPEKRKHSSDGVEAVSTPKRVRKKGACNLQPSTPTEVDEYGEQVDELECW